MSAGVGTWFFVVHSFLLQNNALFASAYVKSPDVGACMELLHAEGMNGPIYEEQAQELPGMSQMVHDVRDCEEYSASDTALIVGLPLDGLSGNFHVTSMYNPFDGKPITTFPGTKALQAIMNPPAP